VQGRLGALWWLWQLVRWVVSFLATATLASEVTCPHGAGGPRAKFASEEEASIRLACLVRHCPFRRPLLSFKAPWFFQCRWALMLVFLHLRGGPPLA